jgi:predicted permease
MVRGFAAHISADLGFDPDDLLTARLDLSADQFKDNGRFWAVARAVLEAAAAVPGISAAALEGPSYPTGGYFAVHFRRHGAPDTEPQVFLRHHVSPGYFRAMGATLLAGRDFDWSDTPAAPRALIVSEELARRTWPGENPIGQRLQSIGADATVWTVVGVVQNIRHEGFASTEARDPHVYLSIFQSPARSPSHVAVLARAANGSASETLADAIGRAAPGVPPYDVRTVRSRLDDQTVQDRAAIRLMAGFGVAALLLATIGVYGVISYTVTTRTREIGIRAALGASRADAVRVVLWQATVPTAVGIAAGLALVAVLHRFVQSLLYGAPASDPAVLAATSIGLLLVGLAAAALPAWRAARIQPVIALGND